MAQNPDPAIDRKLSSEGSLWWNHTFMAFHRINLNLFAIMSISLLYFKRSIYFDLISMSSINRWKEFEITDTLINSRWGFTKRYHRCRIFLRKNFFSVQLDLNPKPHFNVVFFLIRSSWRVTWLENSRVFLIDISLVQIVELILKLHINNRKVGFYLRFLCFGCWLYLAFLLTKLLKSFSPDLQGSGVNQI